MRTLAEILIPGYLSTINLMVYKDFVGFGNRNPIKLPDVVLNYSVDVIRTLGIIMLFVASATPETMAVAAAGYIAAGVAMKMLFDSKIQSQG